MQTKQQYVNSIKPFMPLKRETIGRLLDSAAEAGDTEALADALWELMPAVDGMENVLTPLELATLRAGRPL